MKALLILNGPPYGDEKAYNALRSAHALAKAEPGAEIVVFLMADAVGCAKAGQKMPDGYYNLERMLKRVLAAKGRVPCAGLAWTRAASKKRRSSKACNAARWTSLQRRRWPQTR